MARAPASSPLARRERLRRPGPSEALRTRAVGFLGGFGLFRRNVDRSLGQLSQRFVGGLFFLQGLVEQVCRVVEAKLFGPGMKRAVARNLVMLDSLGGSQHASV